MVEDQVAMQHHRHHQTPTRATTQQVRHHKDYLTDLTTLEPKVHHDPQIFKIW